MNKLKCTPGKWEPQHQQLVAENGKTVAVFVDCGSREENAANARLMAAAPELYEALYELSIETECRCSHPACKRCERDREIINVLAKARGES